MDSRDVCFGGGPEPRPDDDAVGAEDEGCSEPAAVSDPARSTQQRVGRAAGEQVGDLGHERERASRVTVTARFAALRDDDVRAGLDRKLCVLTALHLTQQGNACLLDLWREIPRVAERKEDRSRPASENMVKQLGRPGERPGDEPDTDPRRVCDVELRVDPVPVAVAAADEPEAAGVRDGCRKAAACSERHRCQHDRMGKPEAVGEAGRQRHYVDPTGRRSGAEPAVCELRGSGRRDCLP